jgi:hypothetical protein
MQLSNDPSHATFHLKNKKHFYWINRILPLLNNTAIHSVRALLHQLVSILLRPELLHLLPPTAYERLVLRDLELLAVEDAGALGAGPVAIVGVLLHVELAQLSLPLVIQLFLGRWHRLPSRA